MCYRVRNTDREMLQQKRLDKLRHKCTMVGAPCGKEATFQYRQFAHGHSLEDLWVTRGDCWEFYNNNNNNKSILGNVVS